MCLCATGNHFCEVSCAFVSHYDQRFTKAKHVTQFIIFALRFLSFSVHTHTLYLLQKDKHSFSLSFRLPLWLNGFRLFEKGW